MTLPRSSGHPAMKEDHGYLEDSYTSFGSFWIGLTEKHFLEVPDRCGRLAVRISVGDQEIDLNAPAALRISEQLRIYATKAIMAKEKGS